MDARPADESSEFDEVVSENWEADDDGAQSPSAEPGVLTIRHDLTEDELRRFADFDVFHDPMPFLGFIPQAAFVILIAAGAGAVLSFVIFRSRESLIFGGLLTPVVIIRLLEYGTYHRRQEAVTGGFCTGRVVRIAPLGLSVLVPDASGTPMDGIGPFRCRWTDIRAITTSGEDLVFWMKPSEGDVAGRKRLIVPLRAFADDTEAQSFTDTARKLHADALAAAAATSDDIL